MDSLLNTIYNCQLGPVQVVGEEKGYPLHPSSNSACHMFCSLLANCWWDCELWGISYPCLPEGGILGYVKKNIYYIQLESMTG